MGLPDKLFLNIQYEAMLYTFVIGIVLFLLRLVALFSNKINHFLSVRKNIIPTIQEKISPSDHVLCFIVLP